jgi:hypothetical protein
VRPPLPADCGSRGRSSAGRASPLQGEGQEFESPRLHHLPRTAANARHDKSNTSGQPETTGSIPRRTTVRRQVLRTVYACQDPTDPLIRALDGEPTDQRIAGTPGSQAPGRRTASAVHLNNWIDDGSREDRGRSTARSRARGSRFRREIKENPDHDPVPHWPPGQMLAEVKLHRARGGCLGAKSR